MGKSLFHNDTPEEKPPPPDPYAPDRQGNRPSQKGQFRPSWNKEEPDANWLIVIAFLGLAWLYLMDPIYHAWYKGDAVSPGLSLPAQLWQRVGRAALAACGILGGEDIDNLNHRSGSFRDYYPSPDARRGHRQKIIRYMTNVRLLHDGKYEQLRPRWARMRYAIFIKFGIVVPTQWCFLDRR